MQAASSCPPLSIPPPYFVGISCRPSARNVPRQCVFASYKLSVHERIRCKNSTNMRRPKDRSATTVPQCFVDIVSVRCLVTAAAVSCIARACPVGATRATPSPSGLNTPRTCSTPQHADGTLYRLLTAFLRRANGSLYRMRQNDRIRQNDRMRQLVLTAGPEG